MPTIFQRFLSAVRPSRPALPAPETPTTPVARAAIERGRLSGYPAFGRYAGFLDPNIEITPQDLFGLSPRNLGILYRMRHAHPVIASGMDFAARAVEAVDYGLEPADGSIRARAARDAVERAFRTMRGYTLPSWIAATFDDVRTYGASWQELRSDDGRTLYPHRIAPHLIQMVNYAPDFIELGSVTVQSGAGLQTLGVDALAWYGRQAWPGHYYGLSDLRKLLAIFSAYEQDLRTYLDQQRLARGILHTRETEAGTNAVSVDEVVDWLIAYHNGEDRPIHLPHGIELGVTNVTNPAVAHFQSMLGYYDTLMRETLMSALGSLGINGEGARSLGESFRVVDAQRLRAALDAFLRMINGETSPYSSLLRALTINAGYPAELTPRVVCAGQVGIDMAQQRADLVALSGAGLVTRADIGDEGVSLLVSGLGFTPQPPAEETPTQSAEPLAVGSLQAAIEILGRLTSTDPAMPRIVPDAARRLLRAAGVSADDAEAMVQATVAPEQSAAPGAPGAPTATPLAAATAPAPDPASLIQTRARRITASMQARVLDGLMRHEATPDVTIAEHVVSSARRWAMGQIPSDDDVRAAVAYLATPAGLAALAARPGQPEWLLSQLYGGREGASYWRGEWARRGLGDG
jgi:hypothetical protein